jgi:hypothetical protein
MDHSPLARQKKQASPWWWLCSEFCPLIERAVLVPGGDTLRRHQTVRTRHDQDEKG